LRIADSAADTVFYVGVLVAVVERHWPVIHERLWLVAALLGLEAARFIFDWVKFRRIASYHSYASKAWGALLAMATIALLCFDGAFWLTTVAIVWGILCDLEGLAMSAILPQWAHDVKHLRRALRIRRKMLAASVPIASSR
jgi:CDP-diacylglycerol--glycerol-3-phosphate 3-phosphatidyltransferase